MEDYFPRDEQRIMARDAIKQLSQKVFSAEVNLVILQGDNTPRGKQSREELQVELRRLKQGRANLQKTFQELLAEPGPEPEAVVSPPDLLGEMYQEEKARIRADLAAADETEAQAQEIRDEVQNAGGCA